MPKVPLYQLLNNITSFILKKISSKILKNLSSFFLYAQGEVVSYNDDQHVIIRVLSTSNHFKLCKISINTSFSVYYNKEVIYMGRKTGTSKNIKLTDFSHLITKAEETSENEINEGEVKED